MARVPYRALAAAFVALIPASAFLAGCTQVETGEVGIKMNFGEVEKQALLPGLHFYNWFTSKVLHFEVREQKFEGETDCFTKDTQNARIKYAVGFYPEASKAVEIFSTLGIQWKEKLIAPVILGHLKDTTGQYIADELIAKREVVKNSVLRNLREKLTERGVMVTNVEFVNIDFDDNYEKAVEAKVVAIQKAAEAKNATVQVEEQARQRVIAAEAEARAIKIQSEALAQNKGLVEFEAVKRWDGKLPQYMMGNAVPFVSVPSK